MPQIKVIKGNLNKKDRARNMRGIKKYDDKINFIISNNVDIRKAGIREALKSIKGDKDFAEKIRQENAESEEKEKLRMGKKNQNILEEVAIPYFEMQDEEDAELAEEISYLNKKAKEYVPKSEELMKDFDFKILFENERVIVIDKPAGIMVHPDDKSDEVTLSDIAYFKYENMRDVGEGDRFGIVHRLDRNTTGCLVLCKSRDSYKDMKNIFREHKVRKVYRAIVEGNVRDDMGVIDKPMARTRSDFRKKGVVDMFSKDFRGAERSAITRYKVLERSPDKKFTYVELYPLTGRTHQLRVHMRSIRHPIIGDDLYGSEKGKFLASRSMLHAYKIEFTIRKQEVKITSDIPEDMKQELADKFQVSH